jgi:hypothetical protein
MTKAEDELTALRKEVLALRSSVAELEAKAKPPEPFVPEPWTPIDRTAGMSMPASAMQEMVNAVPDAMVRGIVGDHCGAPQGPSVQGIIPSSEQLTGIHADGGPEPVNATGWRDAAPLGPVPGINYVDAIVVADDARQRAEKKHD